ncbi:MAG TPA: VTT domain-containing protein [Candidatus Paceibacterota bacterium]|nr:VTT domain-containing protein [Candidatus Paceibacterota bacterium]
MNVLASLLSYVLLYKYATIAVVVYSAAVILPLPSNAMLLAVGAFASQGYFDFWLALATAVGANTLGDLTDYGLTRKYGVRVVRALRLHKFRFYNQLQEELRTDAAITVFTTRFAGSLSPVANFLAGLVGVPFKTFFVNDLAGNVIEPLAALALGYAVGDYWEDFSGTLELVAGIVAVAVIMFVLYRIYRRMMRRYDGGR